MWADKQVEYISISVFRKKYIWTILKLHSQLLKLGKANFVLLTFSTVFSYNIVYLFFSPVMGVNQFLKQKHLLSARPLFPLLLKLENEWWMTQATAWRNRIALPWRKQNAVPGGLESALLLLESSRRGVLIVLVFNFISLILDAYLTT